MNLKTRAHKFQTEQRPLSELIPWLHEVIPGFILCKDGSFIVGYEFKGVDIQSSTLDQQQEACKILDTAFADFDGAINLWSTMHRRKSNIRHNKVMPDIVSQSIADAWSISVNQEMFTNTNYFFVQVKPPKTFSTVLEQESLKSINANKGMLQSLIDGLRYAFSYKDRLFSDLKDLEFFIEKVKGYLRGFESGIGFLGAARLEGSKLIGVLTQYVTPIHDGRPIHISNNSFLDNRIGMARVEVDASCIKFEGINDKYAVLLSAKEFPENSVGQLNNIAFLPFEITISQAMQFWDYEVADKHIDTQRDYFEQTMKPFFVMMKEKMIGEELNQVDKSKEIGFHDANAAKAELSKSRVAGLYNLTIVIYGDSEESAISNAEVVHEILKTHSEFPTYRERMHALSAFSGTFPGQYQEPVRWFYFSGPNFSDMTLMFHPKSGNHVNEHLSEELHKEIESLTVFKTPYHSGYHFNFHVGHLGHTFTIGPSGGGKSVLNNFLWTMYRQYNAQVFNFDKDNTCRIPTLLQQGQYIVPGRDDVKVNPMSLLPHQGGQEFVVNWLELLFTSRGYELTSDDVKTIWMVVETLRKSVDARLLRLSSLAAMLPAHLLTHLEPWIGKGPLASYFDHDEDSFNLSDITSIDISRLFTINTTAAIAFMDYCFFRIQLRLDGRPTIINIEELWFPLQHPRFAMRLYDWIRTKRKENVLLLMSTQSLDELVKSENLSLFLGNIVTKIFVPNSSAKSDTEAELYRKFGAREDDIHTISNLQKNGEYLIIQGDERQIIRAKFPKEILSVVMSDKHAQKVMDSAINEDEHSFRSLYMQRMMSIME